jgi:hypothetical protein
MSRTIWAWNAADLPRRPGDEPFFGHRPSGHGHAAVRLPDRAGDQSLATVTARTEIARSL